MAHLKSCYRPCFACHAKARLSKLASGADAANRINKNSQHALVAGASSYVINSKPYFIASAGRRALT